ncbi:hypothetical protein LSAT2_001006 [Lamellibrachia satsuma]|nr:hypothetical protein LSAT2_001006 [Lamellibrachia satsuma]
MCIFISLKIEEAFVSSTSMKRFSHIDEIISTMKRSPTRRIRPSRNPSLSSFLKSSSQSYCLPNLPTRITCPDTFHVTNGDRQVLVKWPEPTTTGKLAGSAQSVYANNRVYLWGRYSNTYIVHDKDGNADTCSFDVFVRKTDCSIDCRQARMSGAKICTSDSPVTPLKFWPHATFDTKYSASKTDTVLVPAAYTCGPNGLWNVWDAMRPFVWPKCTDIKTQKVQLKLTVRYKQLQPCSPLINQIAREIKVWFGKLNQIWGTSGHNMSNGFCSSDNCNEINVKVTCLTPGKRRRRAAEEGVADATVYGLPSTMHGANGQDLSPEDVVKAGALDSPSALDFSGDTYSCMC